MSRYNSEGLMMPMLMLLCSQLPYIPFTLAHATHSSVKRNIARRKHIGSPFEHDIYHSHISARMVRSPFLRSRCHDPRAFKAFTCVSAPVALDKCLYCHKQHRIPSSSLYTAPANLLSLLIPAGQSRWRNHECCVVAAVYRTIGI
jgi:hypothetical protein